MGGQLFYIKSMFPIVGGKVNAVKKIVHGAYAEIENCITLYEAEHFENYTGSSIGLKAETADKTRKTKIRNIRRIMTWLVDRLKTSSIEALFKGISALGDKKEGFFVESPRVNASSGN